MCARIKLWSSSPGQWARALVESSGVCYATLWHLHHVRTTGLYMFLAGEATLQDLVAS